MRSLAVRVAACAVCILGAPACLVSNLHPAYDDKSIVFDETLMGDWEDRESEVSVSLSRGEWRSYQIAFTDRFGTTRFTGHLTTIGAARLLNILPQDGLEKPAFVVATNGLLQIEMEAARVRVRELDYAVVLERAKAGKLGVDTATDVKQNVLVTASSAALRKWLAAALKDETLWAEWKTFTRSVR